MPIAALVRPAACAARGRWTSGASWPPSRARRAACRSN